MLKTKKYSSVSLFWKRTASSNLVHHYSSQQFVVIGASWIDPLLRPHVTVPTSSTNGYWWAAGDVCLVTSTSERGHQTGQSRWKNLPTTWRQYATTRTCQRESWFFKSWRWTTKVKQITVITPHLDQRAFFSFWNAYHSCLVHSNRDTVAYAAPSPCAPSRNTWLARPCPARATNGN